MNFKDSPFDLVSFFWGSIFLFTSGHVWGQISNPLHLNDRIIDHVRLIDLENDHWIFKAQNENILHASRPVRWGKWSGIVDRQAVLLIDGSWIAAELLDRTARSIRVRTRWLDLQEIPLGVIRAVVVTPSASFSEWLSVQQQLSEIQGDDDVVWLRDRNRLSGILKWPSDDELSGSSINVMMAQGEVTIPWTDIQMLAISPALLGPISENRNVTRLGLEDGTLLNTVAIDRTTEIKMRVQALDALTSIDSGKEFCQAINYVGNDRLDNGLRIDQIEPVRFRFLPDSELRFELGVNRSVFGGPLVIGKRPRAGVVMRGLALHSSSQVTYRWDQSPGQFLAEVRMSSRSDYQSRLGNVDCKIIAVKGGEMVVLEEFSLGRQAEMPDFHAVNVDITDAQLVVLLVERGRMGQWGDEVYWLDARFAKK